MMTKRDMSIGPAVLVVAADVAGPVDVVIQGRISHDGDTLTIYAPANMVATVFRRGG